MVGMSYNLVFSIVSSTAPAQQHSSYYLPPCWAHPTASPHIHPIVTSQTLMRDARYDDELMRGGNDNTFRFLKLFQYNQMNMSNTAQRGQS